MSRPAPTTIDDPTEDAPTTHPPDRRRIEPEYREMGDRLRAERRAHGLSLRELASRLGVSPSLISQVETGRATPSVNTLYAIAAELGVSLDDLLFGGRPERAAPPRDTRAVREVHIPDPVQRAHDRKHIRLASGVTWERLTTSTEPGVEFLSVTYEVGGASSPSDAFQRHAGHEWGHVISGTLHVTIGFDDYLLGPGDSVSIDSSIPHRLANDGDEPVRAIWFVLGRLPQVTLAAEHADGQGWLDPVHRVARG